MTDKVLTSYNLMATLNSISANLFTGVYLPLFKRALSRYGQSCNAGKDVDIQESFKSEYGIAIPIYTVRSLLKMVEKNLSKSEQLLYDFRVFSKGKSFQFGTFTFYDIENAYQNEERNSNSLESAFAEYCKSIDVNNELSFSSFIHKYRVNLAEFFSNTKKTKNSEEHAHEYIAHAEFLKIIEENNYQLFEIAKKTFVGSIIAAILESSIDVSTKQEDINTYYFDTQFILRALDLQDEDETAPARELLELLVNQKQDVAILSITLDEIETNIQSVIDHFNSDIEIHAIRSGSIQHACFRKKWSQTDLQRQLDAFIRNPSDFIPVRMEKVTQDFCDRCKTSNDLIQLREKRQNKGSALHDICAFSYVRSKRGGFVRNNLKVKFWFVTANLNLIYFNNSKIENGYVSEMISPDDLTSLLWLRNPTKLDSTVAKIGINNLIAHAIHDSLPKPAVIRIIADNFKKYPSVSPEDYASAMNRLSSKSVVELTKIIDDLSGDENKSTPMIKTLIEEQNNLIISVKERNESLEEKTDDLIKKHINEQDKVNLLSEKLSFIEAELSSNSCNSERLIKDLQDKITQKENEVFLEKNNHQMSSREKSIYKFGFFTLLCIILAYGSYSIIGAEWFRTILTSIISLGGLWSFANFCLNAYKQIKN